MQVPEFRRLISDSHSSSPQKARGIRQWFRSQHPQRKLCLLQVVVDMPLG